MTWDILTQNKLGNFVFFKAPPYPYLFLPPKTIKRIIIKNKENDEE